MNSSVRRCFNMRVKFLAGYLMLMAVILIACASKPLTLQEQSLFRQVTNDSESRYYRESLCHIHHVKTIEMEVPVQHGLSLLPSELYDRVRVRNFPNSFLNVWSGSCEPPYYPTTVVRNVCPKCRALENAWRKKHDY